MRSGHHPPRKKVLMKRLAMLLLPVVLWASLGWGGAALDAPKVTDATLQVYFSPNGDCTEAVVEALGQAKQTILVQAYSFTSAPIATALVDGAVSFAASHSREHMADPQIRAVMQRVQVVGDPKLNDPAAPRSGLVEVTLRDGRIVSHFTRFPPGTKENPVSTEGLNAKARDLMTPVLGA